MTVKPVSRRWIKPKRRPPAPPPKPPPPPADVYAGWREFFTEALSVWFPRHARPDAMNPTAADQYSWCPEWTRHEDAVQRVTLLWRSWEETNRVTKSPGVAMAGWWVHTADPMLRELLSAVGTFSGCSTTGGHHPDFVPLPD